MTAFNVSMLVTADANQARRELQGAEADVQKFGASARQAGNTAAAGFDRAEAEILQFRRASTGATSNLVVQFNDVGQMLVPGQSPLLLAAQQGTQISQVLGPLGAGGAVRALGGAFLGMLNPVNLAVFAAVAGLGILGNSLREVFGETKSLEDAIGDLEGATKAWRDAAKVGTDDLLKQFGRITPEIVEMRRQITELALVEMLLKATDAAAALNGEFDKIFDLKSRSGSIADLLGVAPSIVVNDKNLGKVRTTNPAVSEFNAALDQVASSDNLGEQIAALDRMQDILLKSAGSYTKMSEEQRTFFQQSVALETQLRAVQAAQEGIGSAQQVATAQGEKMLADLREEADLRQLIRRFGDESVEVTVAKVAAERRSLETLLASLDITDQLKRDIRDAWDAANGAETGFKGWLAALAAASGASDETRRAVQDAWDAVTGASGATNVWAGAMAGVAAEVRGIGAALANLGKAGIANAAKEVELEALKAGKSAADARIAATEHEIREDGKLREAAAKNEAARLIERSTTEAKLRGVALDAEIADLRTAATKRDQAAKSAGGASQKQTARAQTLIRSLEDELELLRITDPVQKEMIRNREALAGATEAERQKVEELIRTKQREEKAQKQAQDAWDFSKNAAFDALDALIIQGDKASDVMANLARSIAQALLQSALLGSGPLAGLFGGQGTGLFGGIGSLFGGGDLFSNIGGAATGGMISGPGGPRDDRILAKLSNGEFVVNAAATARHRPLLEQINRAPRFAGGGAVGGASFNAPFGQGGREPLEIHLMLTDDLDARVGATAQDVSVRVMKGGLAQYDAKVLPRRVAQIGNDPRRVG